MDGVLDVELSGSLYEDGRCMPIMLHISYTADSVRGPAFFKCTVKYFRHSRSVKPSGLICIRSLSRSSGAAML